MTKLRLAYFSPLPPARSGIADYSNELLPYLAKVAEITLFTKDPEQISPPLRQHFPIKHTAAYPDLRFQFDLALYHMGNSLHHEALYYTMCRYPGVLVLHDYHLHDVIATLTAGQDDFLGYMREISYTRGQEGLNQLRDLKLTAMGVTIPPENLTSHQSLSATPLSKRLVDLSLGVICHSDYVKSKVISLNPDRPVQVIPHFVIPYHGQSLRQRLPWPRDAFIFATIGYITPDKCLDQALQAFSKLRDTLPQARYLIAGQVLNEVDLPGLLEQYQLQDVVQHIGFVEDVATFFNWIYTADVLVNLRNPTTGETSGPVLRAFAASRPVIVYDHGWYSELPAGVCRKVPPGETDALVATMSELADSPGLRQHIGHQASAYVQAHHHPQTIATHYANFLVHLLNDNQLMATRE